VLFPNLLLIGQFQAHGLRAITQRSFSIACPAGCRKANVPQGLLQPEIELLQQQVPFEAEILGPDGCWDCDPEDLIVQLQWSGFSCEDRTDHL
jgi:hypothetical protein